MQHSFLRLPTPLAGDPPMPTTMLRTISSTLGGGWIDHSLRPGLGSRPALESGWVHPTNLAYVCLPHQGGHHQLASLPILVAARFGSHHLSCPCCNKQRFHGTQCCRAPLTPDLAGLRQTILPPQCKSTTCTGGCNTQPSQMRRCTSAIVHSSHDALQP